MTSKNDDQILNIVEENDLEKMLEFTDGVLSPDDFRELGSLLNLSDENFDLLSETFLSQIENSLNSPTTKILFAESMKRDNVRPDEMVAVFQQAIENLDTVNLELDKKRTDFLKRFFGIAINSVQGLENLSNRTISIPIEKTTDVKTPTYATADSAGMDLYSPKEYTLKPGETIIIPTGIKAALPKGYAFLIQPRSGLSVKTGLRVANTPGLIDSDYRDEIGVIIENIESPIQDIEYDFDNETGAPQIKSILHGTTYTIHKGDRFAQMRLVEVPTAALYEVESVREIGENRGGGFGSTGI